jgi:hypothetical protein
MVKRIKRLIIHYFFPHESNNYKARTLHTEVLVYYIILFLSFQFFSSLVKRSQLNILGYATDITVDKVFSLVNQERVKNNLSPLKLSAELSNAATTKASDMFSKDYWAHISPTGVAPWSFITSSGYNYLYAGENLAKNFTTSEEVVSAWMNSPTHRANILKPEYNDIGLSVMNGRLSGEEITLVVQEFGAKGGEKVAEKQPEGRQLAANEVKSNNTYLAQQKNIALPSTFTKQFSFAFAEFLLIILFIDTIYIWKFKTMRFSGHSLSHIIFLGALIGAMGATGIGVIL